MMKTYYCKLGQLADFEIWNTGRHTKWFHPLVVKVLFNKDVPELNSLPEIDNFKIKSVLQ